MEHIDIAFTKDIVSKKQRQGCKLCLWTECIQQSQAHRICIYEQNVFSNHRYIEPASMNRMYSAITGT